MKRFLLILTVFVLVFSPVITVNAQVSNVDDERLNEAATLLTDLGIVDGNQNYNDGVSRGEFTNMLIKALGIGTLETSNKIPFADVTEEDAYYASVKTAFELGIISPAEEFYPSKAISYNEVVKMTVCAAGYSFIAESYGAYPGGYLAAAQRLGMTDGINNGECNLAMSYILLYNTITTPLPELAIKDGKAEYSIHSNTSILESVYGLTAVEGSVDGAEFFGGAKGNGVGEGKVSISGKIYNRGTFDTDSMFGMYCSTYVDSSNTIRTIYAYSPEANTVLELKSGDELAFNDMKYSYRDEKDRLQTVSVTHDSLIVLNGRAVVFDEKIMVPTHGDVKLLRTNSSSGYNIVIINSYEEFVVGGINTEKCFVTDASEPQKRVSFDEDEYLKIDIYDLNGRSLSFADIEQNDVLWVAKSADSKLLKAIVSKNKFTGEYMGRQGNSHIDVDGKKYPLAKPADELIDPSISFGTVVMVHLNPDNEICHVAPRAEGASVKVGYLVASKLGGGLDSSIKVKIYTADGKMRIFDIAKTFLVNGKKFAATSDDYANLPKDETNPSSMKVGLVSYRTNADGELSSVNYDNITMESIDGASYTNLYKNAQIGSLYGEERDKYIRWYSSPKVIRGTGNQRIFANDSAIQFKVPSAKDISIAEDSRDYSIRKISDIPNGEYLTDYDHIGYTLTEGSMISDYVLSTFDIEANIGSVSTTGGLFIITDVSLGLNSDGDETTFLTVSGSGADGLRLSVKDDSFIKEKSISKGDLVKLEYDMNDVVYAITLVYKCGSNALSNVTNLGDTGYVFPSDAPQGSIMNNNEGMASISSSHITLAKMYDRDGAIVALMPFGYAIGDEANKEFLIKYSLNGFGKVIRYDTKKETVTRVEYTSLDDFIHMGDMYDTVVAEGSGGLIQAFYVYE